jgi:hypothetical protein
MSAMIELPSGRGAARFEIDQARHRPHERIVLAEMVRAEQRLLFPVAHQEDDAALELLVNELPDDLEPDRDAHAVIGGAGAGRNAVVVRRGEDGGPGPRAEAEDHVANVAAFDHRVVRVRATGERFVHRGLEADGFDLGHQARTHLVFRGRVDRVRDLRPEETREARLGGVGVKLPGRVRAPHGRRFDRTARAHACGKECREQQHRIPRGPCWAVGHRRSRRPYTPGGSGSQTSWRSGARWTAGSRRHPVQRDGRCPWETGFPHVDGSANSKGDQTAALRFSPAAHSAAPRVGIRPRR